MPLIQRTKKSLPNVNILYRSRSYINSLLCADKVKLLLQEPTKTTLLV